MYHRNLLTICEVTMNCKIISDSSSNIFALDGVDYTYVPLKIISSEKEYVDTPDLDVDGMIEDLKKSKPPLPPPVPMRRNGVMLSPMLPVPSP